MAVVLSFSWPGATPEQYDAVRDVVHWEEDTPHGAVLHVAWFDADGLRITDVWDTEEDFTRFMQERLAPAVEKVGVPGQPEVSFTTMHRRFVAPGVSGASS
ncbi:hypothetical protein DN069_09040 [Streptacidiphilus pinicola]|uniref:ABM domain-containing protein n=1 Tax=Streptacidiphilus pinicola TaxID=2219663 RepID=A0A2X0ILC2_9ACTN|nr:hypothetical protein [Streptacidiphilus pinicola]RAG85912.1 hypothetical protein DN069_09040 [Streptacidiphilus pinicola]